MENSKKFLSLGLSALSILPIGALLSSNINAGAGTSATEQHEEANEFDQIFQKLREKISCLEEGTTHFFERLQHVQMHSSHAEYMLNTLQYSVDKAREQISEVDAGQRATILSICSEYENCKREFVDNLHLLDKKLVPVKTFIERVSEMKSRLEHVDVSMLEYCKQEVSCIELMYNELVGMLDDVRTSLNSCVNEVSDMFNTVDDLSLRLTRTI